MFSFKWKFFWKRNIELLKYFEKYLNLHCCARAYTWKITSIGNILKEFEQHLGYRLFTDSFSVTVCEQLLVFLHQRNLKDNSIRDFMLKLQAMLNRAQSEGYTVKNNLRGVMPRYAVTQQVFLTRGELKSLYALEGLTTQQEIVRDTFLVGCYTGLRLSDLVTLNCCHIIDNRILKIVRKTKQPISIPLHPTVQEILAKYKNEIPKLKTLQNYNSHIKKICKAAGIDQLVTREFCQGGKIVQETIEKYKLVSSHTGRRTAITNLFLEKVVDMFTLMKFSGHANMASLLIYIKSSSSDHLRILSESSYFKDDASPILDAKLFSLKKRWLHSRNFTKMILRRHSS